MENLVTGTKLVTKLSIFVCDNPLANEGFDGAIMKVGDMPTDELLQAIATSHIAYVKSMTMMQKSLKQNATALCKEESATNALESVLTLCGKSIFANFDPCFLNLAASLKKLLCQRHVQHEDLAALNPALSPMLEIFPSEEHLSAFLQQRAIYSLGHFRDCRTTIEKLAASGPGTQSLTATARQMERLTSLFSACLGEVVWRPVLGVWGCLAARSAFGRSGFRACGAFGLPKPGSHQSDSMTQ